MKKILGWVVTLALWACAEYKQNNSDLHDSLLGVRQVVLDWEFSNIGVFKANTPALSLAPSCLQNDKSEWVLDILNSTPKWRRYLKDWWETVDICIFSNVKKVP